MSAIRKLSITIPVTDESIVDYGLGTPADREAAAQRIEAARLRTRQMWLALPWHVRFMRTFQGRTWEPRLRFTRAMAVLRGQEDE